MDFQRARKFFFFMTVLILAPITWLNPTISWNAGHLNIAPSSAYADSVQYSYDAMGRVIQAANSTSGQATIYAYDAAGNISSTKTTSTGSIVIAGFAPIQGAVGAVVTISGTGFDPTAGANAVSFNTTTAVVTSSTSTSIVVAVPAGASTGLISVTNSAGTATSSSNFIVTN